ncbi:hypothetical protein ACOZ38_03990 [Sphaerisporangium viridialbum]|uniref:hypothetical protein n=1 Tax=Sphaerisporangium viridialbum TaxID=46189 RepID=UPI003C765F73
MSEILSGAVRLIRYHPWPFVGSALVLTIVTDLLAQAWTWLVITALTDPKAEVPENVQAGSTGLFGIAALYLVSFALQGAVQAVLVVQAMTGESVTIRKALGLLRRRVRTVVGVTAFLVLGEFVWLILLGVTAFLSFGQLARLIFQGVLSSGAQERVSLGVAGFEVVPVVIWLLVAVPGTLLMAFFTVFAPAAAALEPVGTGRALRRSLSLAGNGFWRVIGVLLTSCALLLISSLVYLFAALLFSALFAVLLLAAPPAIAGPELWGQSLFGHLFSWLSTGIYGSISAWWVAVVVLLYLDLRMRREGLGEVLWHRWTANQTAFSQPVPAGTSGPEGSSDPEGTPDSGDPPGPKATADPDGTDPQKTGGQGGSADPGESADPLA